MGGRAPGPLQSGHLHPADAQHLQSDSVRPAGFPAEHLYTVREGIQRKKFERYDGIGDGPVCWVGSSQMDGPGYLDKQEAQGWGFGTEYT